MTLSDQINKAISDFINMSMSNRMEIGLPVSGFQRTPEGNIQPSGATIADIGTSVIPGSSQVKAGITAAKTAKPAAKPLTGFEKTATGGSLLDQINTLDKFLLQQTGKQAGKVAGIPGKAGTLATAQAGTGIAGIANRVREMAGKAQGPLGILFVIWFIQEIYQMVAISTTQGDERIEAQKFRIVSARNMAEIARRIEADNPQQAAEILKQADEIVREAMLAVSNEPPGLLNRADVQTQKSAFETALEEYRTTTGTPAETFGKTPEESFEAGKQFELGQQEGQKIGEKEVGVERLTPTAAEQSEALNAYIREKKGVPMGREQKYIFENPDIFREFQNFGGEQQERVIKQERFQDPELRRKISQGLIQTPEEKAAQASLIDRGKQISSQESQAILEKKRREAKARASLIR